MKETLNRKVGPFTVGVWLLIVIIGVTIGLIVRRNRAFRPDFSGQAAQPSNPGDPAGTLSYLPTQGVSPTYAADAEGWATEDFVREFEDRWLDEVDVILGKIEKLEDDAFTSAVLRNEPGVIAVPTPAPATPAPAPAIPAPAPAPAPAPTGATYTVVRGDTLWGIASRHLGNGARWPEILNLNPNSVSRPGDVTTLRVGYVLTLPAR